MNFSNCPQEESTEILHNLEEAEWLTWCETICRAPCGQVGGWVQMGPGPTVGIHWWSVRTPPPGARGTMHRFLRSSCLWKERPGWACCSWCSWAQVWLTLHMAECPDHRGVLTECLRMNTSQCLVKDKKILYYCTFSNETTLSSPPRCHSNVRGQQHLIFGFQL